MTLLAALLLVASARDFPGGYDWRYEVMCRLGYPSANPQGCRWWSAALAVTCVMGLPCCTYFRERLGKTAPKTAAAASGTLCAGLLAGLIVAADGVLVPKLNQIAPKLHEVVSTIAFAAIFFGVLGFWSATMRWLRTSHGWAFSGCAAMTVLVVAPLAGAMISQAILFYVPNDLGWVDRDWAARGVPVYLSFAFWEWLAVGAVYAGLYIIALLLPARTNEIAAR